MIVDLQVNIEAKEGAPPDPEAFVQGAKQAGLDGVLLTQENALIPDVARFRQAGEACGVRVFAGAKIATNHGVILCVLPNQDLLADDFATMAEGVYDATSVIDAIEAKGGVTVALRPYDREVPRPMGDHLFSLQGLSACEVQNGRVPDIANDLALEAASNMEMPCVGTSCADGLEGLGTSATLFRNPVTSEAELCEAIRSGDCWPVSFSDVVPQGEERSGGGGDRSGPSRPAGDRGGEGGRRRGRRGGRRRGGGGGGDRGYERGGDRGGGERVAGDRPPGGGGGGGGERSAAGRGPGGGGGGGGGPRYGGGGGGGGGGDRGGFGGGGGGGGDRGGFGGGGGGGDRGRGRGGRGGRGRGRGGRGRGGPRPDDIGNRAPQRDPNAVDDNVGNYVPENERNMDEDFGNRLRPGEQSLFARRPAPPAQQEPQVHDEDDDDNLGNR